MQAKSTQIDTAPIWFMPTKTVVHHNHIAPIIKYMSLFYIVYIYGTAIAYQVLNLYLQVFPIDPA
jgi:hypothetical protein